MNGIRELLAGNGIPFALHTYTNSLPISRNKTPETREGAWRRKRMHGRGGGKKDVPGSRNAAGKRGR